MLERVGEQRAIVALDLPGFGASPPLAGEVSIATLADAVAGLVAELGLKRPHAAGNSLGGALALELARTGRARSATGLSPLGFARGREISFARASLAGSRGLARVLRPLTPALLTPAAGRALLQSQLFARPVADAGGGGDRRDATSPARRGSPRRCRCSASPGSRATWRCR